MADLQCFIKPFQQFLTFKLISMQKYTIIWLLLGGGFWLLLQQLPSLASWQLVLFLTALVMAWIFCAIIYYIATFFDKDIATKSAVIGLLKKIVFWGNKSDILITHPSQNLDEKEKNTTYLTQNEALRLIDTAFGTFNNSIQTSFTSLIDKKIDKRLEDMSPPTAAPTFEWSNTEVDNSQSNYQQLLEKLEQQNKLISELEKKRAIEKKEQLQLQEKNKQQFYELQHQLTQLNDQQNAINDLKKKRQSLEKNYAAAKPTSINDAPWNDILKKIQALEATDKKVAKILETSIKQLEKQLTQLTKNVQTLQKQSALPLNTLFEQINELEAKHNNGIQQLENQLKALKNKVEQSETNDTTTDLQQMLKNFDEILAGQEETMEDLKNNLVVKDGLQDILQEWQKRQAFPNLEQVNELIEDALQVNKHQLKQDYITADQFQEGLMELAENLKEQIQALRE